MAFKKGRPFQTYGRFFPRGLLIHLAFDVVKYGKFPSRRSERVKGIMVLFVSSFSVLEFVENYCLFLLVEFINNAKRWDPQISKSSVIIL